MAESLMAIHLIRTCYSFFVRRFFYFFLFNIWISFVHLLIQFFYIYSFQWYTLHMKNCGRLQRNAPSSTMHTDSQTHSEWSDEDGSFFISFIVPDNYFVIQVLVFHTLEIAFFFLHLSIPFQIQLPAFVYSSLFSLYISSKKKCT